MAVGLDGKFYSHPALMSRASGFTQTMFGNSVAVTVDTTGIANELDEYKSGYNHENLDPEAAAANRAAHKQEVFDKAIKLAKKKMQDKKLMKKYIDYCSPEIIFHLAAQPLVLSGYEKTHNTWNTNVMGTVNLTEEKKEMENSQIQKAARK